MKLLTTKEVAEILKKKPDTLAKWRRAGMGPPFIWVEGTVRYEQGELEEWLRKNTHNRSQRDGEKTVYTGAKAEG